MNVAVCGGLISSVQSRFLMDDRKVRDIPYVGVAVSFVTAGSCLPAPTRLLRHASRGGRALARSCVADLSCSRIAWRTDWLALLPTHAPMSICSACFSLSFDGYLSATVLASEKHQVIRSAVYLLKQRPVTCALPRNGTPLGPATKQGSRSR
jgi:hypothetical protein